MKTAVLMKRDLMGSHISQNSKTEMLSATDLVKIGNKWRILNELEPFDMKSWLKNKGTKEFISELESRYGEVKKMARGRGHHTWFHPLLFIDMALAINPKLKVEVYQWLFDELIKSRNDSGDSYKPMCGALYAHTKNKAMFYKEAQSVANRIKEACSVKDWNEATTNQLKLRDKIHNNIALLADVMNNNDEAVRIGIEKAIK